MSFRAAIIGILLGLSIAGFSYFNDAVAHGTKLIGNQFPIGVFGILMLLLIVVNPLLGRLRSGWRLRAGELALITALGLAVCGWPGSGFFRYFATSMALPSKMIASSPAWQAAQVMSYVPGGSSQLGMGHLHDEAMLCRELVAVERGAGRPVDRAVWERLSPTCREVAKTTARSGQINDADKTILLAGLNKVIGDRGFYDTVPAGERSEDVKAALTERERVQDEIKHVEERRSGLMKQREEVLAGQGPEPRKLLAERVPLLAQRTELSKKTEELNARVQDLMFALATQEQKSGGMGTPGTDLKGQIAALDEEIDGIKVEMEGLEKKLNVIDGRLAKLDDPVKEVDNQILRMDGILSSLTRWSGTEDRTGILEEKANRWVLVGAYPESISAPPRGEGALPVGGDDDPYVVDTMNQGWSGPKPLGLTELPWEQWWPALRLWGTVALLMGIAVLCLAVIVHPQWSRRELLAYPIARFVEEATQTDGVGGTPTMLRSRLFWYGFGALIVLHAVNGLHTWFPDQMFLFIPLKVDYSPLGDLIPNAMKIPSSPNLSPTIYLSVLAFAYFLNTEVSFSLGIAGFAWGMLGAYCYTHGIPLQSGGGFSTELGMLQFGSGLGLTLMVIYVGRRYYLNVAASAIGFRANGDTPDYATWAARVMILCLGGSVVMMGYGGLHWSVSIPTLILVLVVAVVIARVTAESGVFFMSPGWGPAGVLAVLIGVDAISPQTMVMMCLLSMVLAADPRETFLPYLVNGLRMVTGGRASQEERQRTVRRVVPLMALVIVAGFFVAGAATFYLQYNRGFDYMDIGATQGSARSVPTSVSVTVSTLSAHGTLVETTGLKGLDWVKHVSPDGKQLGWAAFGAGLVLVTAVARLRLAWWPIHPVLFIFWGSWPRKVFAASFFLGWLIKVSMVKLGGVQAYQRAKPLLVGIIAGELVAALAWMLAGAIYWAATGQVAPSYFMTPG